MFARLMDALKRLDLVRPVTTLSSGSVLGQAFVLAASPILTRLYPAEQFGVLGIAMSLAAVLSIALTLRLETAAVAAGSKEEAIDIARAALLLIVPMFVAASVLLGVVKNNSWVGALDLPAWGFPSILLLAASLSISSIGRQLLVREGRFALVAGLSAAQGGLRSLVQVLLALPGAMAPFGLLVGELSGRFASGLAHVWSSLRGSRRPWLPDAMLALRRYRSFAVVLGSSGLLNASYLNGLVPLAAGRFGADGAGQFFLVIRVLALPSALLGRAVGDAFHRRFAAALRSEESTLFVFWATVAFLAAVIVAPVVAVVVWGEPLFEWAFGGSWSIAGAIASRLAPWLGLGFVVSPVSQVVLALRKPGAKLAYDLLGLAVLSVTFVLESSRAESLLDAATMLGWLGSAAYLTYLFLLHRLVRSSSGAAAPC